MRQGVYSITQTGELSALEVENINAYLVPGKNIEVEKASKPISSLPTMTFGNQPIDGGHFTVLETEKEAIKAESMEFAQFVHRYVGSREFINGIDRWCLWVIYDPRTARLVASE